MATRSGTRRGKSPRHPAVPALDRTAGEAEMLQPGEALDEAERELGMNDWIDPQTGEPAEGESPPHLERE